MMLFCAMPASAADMAVEWWQNAAAPYKGNVIHVVSEESPPSVYMRDKLAPAFEALTGINVAFETVSWADAFERGIQDMATGSGLLDAVYVEQDIVYAYLAQKYLANISQLFRDHPELASPNFHFEDFTSFLNYYKDPTSGDVFGMPFEAFTKFYVYRKDLFADANIQKAFQAEYGEPLAPAETIDQYRKIAAFFTKWGKDHSLELWGATVQGKLEHGSVWSEFTETILPIFGIYQWGLNMETKGASVAKGGSLNSDTAKAALQFWLDMLQYAPPEALMSTWDEVAFSLAAGRAAQGFIYGDQIPKVMDPATSKVIGKLGYALPPMMPGVLDDANAGKGYIGYYDGGALSIPHCSKNKEAALLFLQYIGQPSVQADWAVETGRVVHQATFDDPQILSKDQEVGGYFALMRDNGHLFAGAPPFPAHAELRETAVPFIWQALAGQLSAEQALDQAAEAVDQFFAKEGE